MYKARNTSHSFLCIGAKTEVFFYGIIITNHLQKVTIKTTKGDLDYLSGNMSQLVIEYKKKSKVFGEQ